jgi:AraC-like DNA-binding protein
MAAEIRQQDPLVQELICWILERQDEALTEIRLAELVCYSVTHIRRVFYAAMSESLGDFMQRVRLERAAGMLSVGTQPVNEIALAVNYQSGEAFARAFRARFQSPPTMFRVLNSGQERLLPGYIYSTEPATGTTPREVGLCLAQNQITTYIYEGLALVSWIAPEPLAIEPIQLGIEPILDQDQMEGNG